MARLTTSSVLDASALLAFLFGEAGAEQFVVAAGPSPAMSAVNWSEVHQKSTAHGVPGQQLLTSATQAGVEIVDLTVGRAERVSELWPATRRLGLSIADRACLTLALELGRPAVTADRSWSRLTIPGLVVHALR